MVAAKNGKLKKKAKKEELEPDDYCSFEQMTQIFEDVIERSRSRRTGSKRAAVNEMIVILLFATGLRASELCDLKMKDMPHRHGKDLVFVRYGKNGRPRSVPIQSEISAKIRTFVKMCRKHAKKTSYFFVNERGWDRRLDYHSLYSKIVGIGRRAGVEVGKNDNLHPHVLRHSALSLAYSVTNDRELVQKMAGHKHSDTTSIYIHMGTKAVREKINEVNVAGFLT